MTLDATKRPWHLAQLLEARWRWLAILRLRQEPFHRSIPVALGLEAPFLPLLHPAPAQHPPRRAPAALASASIGLSPSSLTWLATRIGPLCAPWLVLWTTAMFLDSSLSSTE